MSIKDTMALELFIREHCTLRYDTMAQEKQIFDKDQQLWRRYTDNDDIRLMLDAARKGINSSSKLVYEFTNLEANRNVYDGLKAHILNQPPWDGQKRLDSWLMTHMGAEPSPYVSRVGRLWLISAMARAFRPGVACKVDTVLILRGAQGVGKSTMLRDLGGPFFSDADFDFEDDQKAGMKLRSVWIHEWSELDSMKKASHTRLKAFVSETVNRFRPPYGRQVAVEPRRCVFAGSTNKDDFLTDTTGNRRFWPVYVKGYIKPFGDDRGQLLSEARAAFEAGERWWPLREDEELASGYRKEVEEVDPWRDEIAKSLEGKAEVTTNEILEDTLGISLDRLHQGHYRRVGDVLRQLGYVRTNRENKERHRIWQRM